MCALLALHVVPIWLAPHYPSQDGPSHLYQAWVLHAWSELPLLQEHFTRNFAPFPNWLGYALLQPLLALFAPATAEKLLLTLYALTLPLAVLYFAGRARWLLGLLGFAFVFNFSLQLGLHNFCLSLPLLFAVLGLWRRRRDTMDIGSTLLLALLLVLLYFAHIVGLLLALLTLLGIGLLTMRPAVLRSRCLLLAALVPALALLAWFLGQQPTNEFRRPEFWPRLLYLVMQRGLIVTDAQLLAAGVLDAILLGLGFVTLRGRRDGSERAEPAFAWLALVVVAGVLLLPDVLASGGALVSRLALLWPLLLLPALELPQSRAALRLLAVAIALVIGSFWITTVGYLRDASHRLEQYLCATDQVPKRGVVLPVFASFAAPWNRAHLNPLAHAGNWYALAAEGANLWNFHATNQNFPVLGRKPPSTTELPGGDACVVFWDEERRPQAAPAGGFRAIPIPAEPRLLVYVRR